jgi:rare lipoprotein A
MLSQPMRGLILASIALVALSGCGKKKVKLPPVARPPAPGVTAPSKPPAGAVPTGQVERGNASWYGHPYHGRRTANGEVYDMETYVAAHRTLPFQTWVRVRNLTNDRTVDVRIVDRGPFVGNRIIDLSHAAAKEIELIGPGVGPVELTILSAPVSTVPAAFGVQVGAFRERSNADRLQQNLIATYGAATVVERPGEPTLWRVLAGREPSQEAAEALAKRVRVEQKVAQAFVVRLD